MRVRYLHAIGGHTVGDVDEMRDRDALRLIDQGYVVEDTGEDTTPDEEPADEDTAITFGPDGRTTTVDREARADRHSGMGSTALPDDVEPVHIAKRGDIVPDEDETEAEQGEDLDGLSARELRSLAEAKGLATSGTKDDLKARIVSADEQSTED
ncbi:SAP domain-containing protein [Amycolatopsis sp. NPDC004368]